MTHEQIIAELVRIWQSPHLDLSLKAGLAEAIEALNGADGDIISRQYALAAINYIEANEGLGLVDLREIVESLTSAEPKTKIGKWIAKSERYRWMRKCSVCGWMQEIDTPKMQGWVYRYCPNCGARMTKGGDDE